LKTPRQLSAGRCRWEIGGAEAAALSDTKTSSKNRGEPSEVVRGRSSGGLSVSRGNPEPRQPRVRTRRFLRPQPNPGRADRPLCTGSRRGHHTNFGVGTARLIYSCGIGPQGLGGGGAGHGSGFSRRDDRKIVPLLSLSRRRAQKRPQTEVRMTARRLVVYLSGLAFFAVAAACAAFPYPDEPHRTPRPRSFRKGLRSRLPSPKLHWPSRAPSRQRPSCDVLRTSAPRLPSR